MRAQFVVQVVFETTATKERSEAVDENAEEFAHSLTRAQHPVDYGGHASPTFRFFLELLASGAGQGIKPSPAVAFRNAPLGGNPARLVKAQQPRIECSLVQLQQILGDLLDAQGDAEAMHR